MDEIWPKFFCFATWIFILVAGLAGDDYNQRSYTMAIGLIIATILLNERKRQAAHLREEPVQAYWLENAARL